MNRLSVLLLAASLCSGVTTSAAAPSDEPDGKGDEAAVHEAIGAYHRGFERKDADVVRGALGDSFVMFNGNHSDDPTRWQAHLYLQGEDLDAWPAWMIAEAGPFENRFSFESTHVRGEAALVVTLETGRNRFRSWEGQRVTWLLGRNSGRWGIVGLFVRDERNPEAVE